MTAQRILIVDKEQPILQQLANTLNKFGYQATGANSSEPIPNNLTNSYYDLIAFGKNTESAIKQRYEDTLRLNNPALIAVTGVSPSVPVMADQVLFALNKKKKSERPVSYINYDINEGCLVVMLRLEKDCDIEISLYCTGLFYGTTHKQLHSGRLNSGERFFKYDASTLSGFGAKYLVIRVDQQTSFMQRL